MFKDSALWKRLSILGTGYSVNFLITWAFDDWLYPIVINQMGAIVGSVIMTGLSFIICFLTIVYYNWKRVDWLGIESYKDKAVGQETGYGRWSRFILLSLATDPFIVTAFMRDKKNRFAKLNKFDWQIFLSSLIISNVTWTLITMTSLSAMEGDIGLTILVLTLVSIIMPIASKWL